MIWIVEVIATSEHGYFLLFLLENNCIDAETK